MATQLSEQLREASEAAFRELDDARADWERSVAEARSAIEERVGRVQTIESRLNLIAKAIDLSGETNGHGDSESSKPVRAIRPGLGPISAENQELAEAMRTFPASCSWSKVVQIHEYLVRHGEARQADIVRAMKMNSGSVSVALRFLHETGYIAPGERRDSSQVWEAWLPEEDLPAPQGGDRKALAA